MLQRVDIPRRQREKRTGYQRIDEMGYSYHQWRSENAWRYVSGPWELKRNQKTDDTATIRRETRNLGIGEFADWISAEVIMRKQGYAHFLLGRTEAQLPEKKRFADRARYKEAGITMDVSTVAVGWEMKNMTTFGG